MRNVLLIVAAIVSIAFQSCKLFQPTDAKTERMVIVFAPGGADVKRGADTLQASVGFVLLRGDEVRSKEESVDIQSTSGSLIRLKAYSSVKITSLSLTNSTPETKLEAVAGKMLVKVNKKTKNEEFSVVTPTALAGVRGTLFAIELDQNGKTSVKVFEGSVAMRMRSKALETFSQEQIESSEGLKKAQKLLEEYEVIIEGNHRTEITTTGLDVVQLLNQRIEATGLEMDATAVDEIQEKVDPEKGLRNQEEVVSPQEKADSMTLVDVSDDLLNKVDSNTEDKSVSNLIETEHKEKLDQSLTKIENDATSKGLQSKEDIRKYYSVLEVLTKTSGEKYAGAVVTQVGDILILHTPTSVMRIPKGEISFIDYEIYDVKLKKK